jgi:hypothetical protein
MSDVDAFFGKGYKNQTKGYMKAIKGTLESDDISGIKFIEPKPSDDCGVAINVMGTLYEGKEKIEMIGGDIIVDGIISGKAPITSGTWVKTLKGEYWKNPHDKKNTLSIWSKCDII